MSAFTETETVFFLYDFASVSQNFIQMGQLPVKGIPNYMKYNVL